jgi:hypothetical protein
MESLLESRRAISKMRKYSKGLRAYLGLRALCLCGADQPSAHQLGCIAPCDNQADMDATHAGIQDAAEPRAAGTGFAAGQRLAIWLALSVLAALIVYAGFRGYLNPELLFHFAAGLHC